MRTSDELTTVPLGLWTGSVLNMFGWLKRGALFVPQALRDNSMSSYMTSKKTMEINPENAIVQV